MLVITIIVMTILAAAVIISLENTSLTLEDLKQMNKNAVRGAFINPQKKAELVAALEQKETDKTMQK